VNDVMNDVKFMTCLFKYNFTKMAANPASSFTTSGIGCIQLTSVATALLGAAQKAAAHTVEMLKKHGHYATEGEENLYL
jgi:hypothetical protein